MDHCEIFFQLPESQRPAYLLKHLAQITPKAMQAYLLSRDIKKYYYLVTFTIKPEHNNKSDQIEDYIKQQFTNRPALGVLEAHIVKELTKSGISHWHVALITSKHLAKDRFQYYTQLWGNIDISKNHSQNLNDSINYLSKSGTPTRLC